MKAIRLAVIDDHSLFRQGLVQLLQTDPDITVVAEGVSGEQAVTVALEHRPDVMLMDVEMPGPGAEAVLTAIRDVSPDTAVVILTVHDAAVLLGSLVELGAAGYLLKSADRSSLIAAIHTAAVGDSLLVSVSRATLNTLARGAGEPGQLLSPRELEVLRLVGQARSNADIAAELFISRATVKRHLTSIYNKLGANGRVDALIKAAAAHLVPDDENRLGRISDA